MGWRKILFVLLCGWSLLSGCRPSEPELLPVKLEGVMMDPQTGSPVLFLVDSSSERGVPVWIGVNEARSISMELQGLSSPRPLTHDLLKRVLDLLDARVERVVITDLRENTYYAILFLSSGTRQWQVDSRPSDAIALALKCRAPIYVSRELQEKGVFVDLRSSPFALPMEQRLGFSVQDLSPALTEYFGLQGKKGVLLTEVISDGPAERAGLRKGDVLFLMEGEPVTSLVDLRSVLEEKESEESIRVEVYRSGKTVSAKLKPKRQGG